MQSVGNQHRQRLLHRNVAAGEIVELRELSAHLVPGGARPVVHALQRQMKVFIGLQFDRRESSLASRGQNAKHRSIRCSERRHLRVERLRPEPSVERLQVARDQRAPAARHFARATGDAAGICCTRRKLSISTPPDGTRWRRLRSPPQRRRHQESRRAFGRASPGSSPNYSPQSNRSQ